MLSGDPSEVNLKRKTGTSGYLSGQKSVRASEMRESRATEVVSVAILKGQSRTLDLSLSEHM